MAIATAGEVLNLNNIAAMKGTVGRPAQETRVRLVAVKGPCQFTTTELRGEVTILHLLQRLILSLVDILWLNSLFLSFGSDGCDRGQ